MSARDDLLDWLNSHPDFPDHHASQGDVADDILNHHAHELAEKQRNMPTPAAYLAVLGWAAIYRQAANDVANLIDPEVAQP